VLLVCDKDGHADRHSLPGEHDGAPCCLGPVCGPPTPATAPRSPGSAQETLTASFQRPRHSLLWMGRLPLSPPSTPTVPPGHLQEGACQPALTPPLDSRDRSPTALLLSSLLLCHLSQPPVPMAVRGSQASLSSGPPPWGETLSPHRRGRGIQRGRVSGGRTQAQQMGGTGGAWAPAEADSGFSGPLAGRGMCVRWGSRPVGVTSGGTQRSSLPSPGRPRPPPTTPSALQP